MTNLRLYIFLGSLAFVFILSFLYIVIKLGRQIRYHEEQTCNWYNKFVSMEKLYMQRQHDYSLLQDEYKTLEEEYRKLNEENKRTSLKRTKLDAWLL